MSFVQFKTYGGDRIVVNTDHIAYARPTTEKEIERVALYLATSNESIPTVLVVEGSFDAFTRTVDARERATGDGKG